MSEILCKIKIKLKDYYPRIKIIPYQDYYCSVSYDNDNLTFPLKNYGDFVFENVPKKISSDLIYNISLLSNKSKYLISKSNLVIAFNRLIQVIKMKNLKYEQQIRLFIEKDIKEKIFGPGFFFFFIFLKFGIELIGTKDSNSNIFLPNNDNLLKKKSKIKNKSEYDFNINSSITNLSIIKNCDIIKTTENFQNNRLSTNYSTQKADDYNHNYTSINKPNKSKSKYLYTQTSPFALQNYYKHRSEQTVGKKKSKRVYKNYNYLSPKNDIKNIFIEEIPNNNINLKRYYSRKWNDKLYSKKEDFNKEYFLPNRFNDISIREKKETKRQKTERKINNKNEIKKFPREGKKSENPNKNISIEKNETKKINKKNSFKVKNNNKSNIIKKKSKNQNDSSICKLVKRHSLKSQTTKNFYNNRNNSKRDEAIKIEESKTTFQKIDLYKKNFKEFYLIKPVNTQEDLKNNIISMINCFIDKNKETKLSYINNINKADSQYLLYREKIVLENKKAYSLQGQNNVNNIKDFIHVKINSKYNNVLFNKMLKMKIKEFNIIKIILHNRNQNEIKNNLLQEKLKQQKQILVLLNLIRNLLKTYGNLSHLFDEDNNKKILIKSLFLRYNIKEKEWNNNDNLIEIYNKMINEIKNNKKEDNMKKALSIKEEFKVIKEENEIEEEEEEMDKKEESFSEKDSNKESNEENKKENSEEKKVDQKEEIKSLVNEGKNMKENINNENLNNEKINEEKIIKYDKNNIIGLDKNIKFDSINTDLVNNKNIIINNFIINK